MYVEVVVETYFFSSQKSKKRIKDLEIYLLSSELQKKLLQQSAIYWSFFHLEKGVDSICMYISSIALGILNPSKA